MSASQNDATKKERDVGVFNSTLAIHPLFLLWNGYAITLELIALVVVVVVENHHRNPSFSRLGFAQPEVRPSLLCVVHRHPVCPPLIPKASSIF
jgi:hypothetical protein